MTFWDLMYALGITPWDTGITPPEVQRVVEEGIVKPPARCLDLGCGTGTNVVFLAQKGFDVVGVDISRWAVRRARARIARARVNAQCHAYDVTRLHLPGSPVRGPFQFVLDIGCFHGFDARRRQQYREMLAALLESGGHYLVYVHMDSPEEGAPVVRADVRPDWRRRLIRVLGGKAGPPSLPRQVVEDTFGPVCDLVWVQEGHGGMGKAAWFLWRRR